MNDEGTLVTSSRLPVYRHLAGEASSCAHGSRVCVAAARLVAWLALVTFDVSGDLRG